MLFFIEDILLLMHVDALTAGYASIYTRNMLFGLYVQAQFDLLRKFMIILGQPLIPMLIQGLTLPLHILFCYLFVNKAGYGIFGVALATNLTFFINFLFVFIAVSYLKVTRQCLTGVQKSTTQKVLPYLVLGIPTAAMTCMDIWAFSVLTLIAHFLGPDENAGQVILLNVLSILYSIPMGFASASCALVGKNIGKGKVAKAKIYGKQCLLLVMIVSLIPCICFSAFPT